MPCQGKIRTRGASKYVKRRGNDKVFIALPTQCKRLKKVYSIEMVIGGLVKIPMEEEVVARDGIGERVVGGAVGSAKESW